MSQLPVDSNLSRPLLDTMNDPDISINDFPSEGDTNNSHDHASRQNNKHNNSCGIESTDETPFWKNPAQITAMVSNFSTSYNAVNISLALPMLMELYTTTEEQQAAVSSSLLAGMICGQLLGGYLGDSWLGRLGALKVVMVLQIVASLASALLVHGSNVLVQLALWRFLLGVGAGGVYPLAAVLSAEQGHLDDKHDETDEEKRQKLHRVVVTFSMQGLGFLSVSLVTVPLLYLVSDLNLVWRIILGLGSLPGIVLALLQSRLYGRSISAVARHDLIPQNDDQSESVEVQQVNEDVVDHRPSGTVESDDTALVSNVNRTKDGNGAAAEHIAEHTAASLWQAIRHEPDLAQKLLGTAGTWFLFDVLFYGNTLFEPIVMEAAFGGKTAEKEIKRAATDSLMLNLIALPGYLVSAVVIGRRLCYIQQTPRFVQSQGFAAMALIYAVIGAYWSYLRRVPALLVLLYGTTFFFANYGPNTTTFVLPSLVYAPECRSTLNGISAASGKLGALLGAMLFEPAADAYGDGHVMLICAAVSVMAFAATRFFVRLPSGHHSVSTIV
jgi:PHS family inorganic phosphate transporter-like MFS transporter